MYLALRRYSRPTTVEQCLQQLLDPHEASALLAGGTFLNAQDNESLTHLIDTQALPLQQLKIEEDVLRIGAGVTLGRLRRHPALQKDCLLALRQAAAAFANVGMQNRSTVGGRVALDRSDQDIPVALLALGARLKLYGLDNGRAVQSVIEYPIGASARTALCDALIAEVEVPVAEGRSALRRFGRTAVDVPLASCAATWRQGQLTLAAGLQGPGAASLKRLRETEKLATDWGSKRPADWRVQARDKLRRELLPYRDTWASSSYRHDLSATLMVRAMANVFGEEEVS